MSVLLLAALFVSSAFGALPQFLDASFPLHTSESFPFGLRGLHVPFAKQRANQKHHHHEEKKDWTEEKAYAVIKFIVPPSKQDDFEEAWLKLQDEVDEKEGDKAEIFDLKQAKLTNTLYWSYGEWHCMNDLHEHLTSDHFQDFAEAADDLGIKWEFTWLESAGQHGEEEHGREEGKAEEDLFSVIVLWLVPPQERESFADVWNKAAEKQIKTEGTKQLSLSKAVKDNVLWLSYGSWDSRESYLEHRDSEGHEELEDYAEEKDIVQIIVPVEKIGSQRE